MAGCGGGELVVKQVKGRKKLVKQKVEVKHLNQKHSEICLDAPETNFHLWFLKFWTVF